MKSVRPRSSLGSAFVLPRTSARCRCLVVHPSVRTLPCLFIRCAPVRAHSSVLVYPRALFRARTLPCSFILVTNFYLSRLPDFCIYPMHLLQLETCFCPCRLLLLVVDTYIHAWLPSSAPSHHALELPLSLLRSSFTRSCFHERQHIVQVSATTLAEVLSHVLSGPHKFCGSSCSASLPFTEQRLNRPCS